MAIGRHADGPVLEEAAVGDRGGRPDRHFDGGLVALAGLHPPVEVEEDPDVGGLLQVELLDLDLAVAGRRLPVDPVEAVARRVGPDGRRERGRLERPFGRRVAALDASPPAGATAAAARPAGRRRAVSALADRRRRLEEPERIAGPDLERLDPEVAAASQRRLARPTTARRANRARAPGRPGRRAGSWGCGPRARAWACGPRCAACRSGGACRRPGRGAG